MNPKRVIQGAGLAVVLAGSSALPQTERSLPPAIILGPSGGDVRALALDPSDPAVLYAGTADGIIYKSTDGAGTWTRLQPGIGRRGLVVSRILLHPHDARTLYAGAWQLRTSGGGLFRSRNGGETWQEILFDTADSSVRALAIAPSDPRRIYVGTLRGVYRSDDDGQNWRLLAESTYIAHGIESLLVDPQDAERVLAGSRRMSYSSQDGGEHWLPSAAGMQDDSDVFDLLALPGRGNGVLAAACTGLFVSADGGQNWTHASLGNGAMKLRTRVLGRDPQSEEMVYAGTTNGLYRSTNGGASWQFWYGQDMVINAVVVSPSDSAVIYLGVDDLGVLKSSDGGRTFSPSNSGLIHRSVAAGVADRRDPAHLITGIQFDGPSGGVFRSRDGGRSWDEANAGIPSEDRNISVLFQHPSEPDTYYAGTAAGLYVSRDGAINWQRVPAAQISDRITTLAGRAVPSGARLYAGGPSGLFMSQDGGPWMRVAVGQDPIAVSALMLPSEDPDRVVVGTAGRVFITEDGGRNWLISATGLPSVTIQALMSPWGWEGAWLAGNRYGVFRSHDQGVSWERVGAELGTADVTAFAAVAGDTLLAADALAGQLLASRDWGRSWTRMALQGAGSRIWTLWLGRGSGPRLFAGTASDGIYAFDLLGRPPGSKSAPDPLAPDP